MRPEQVDRALKALEKVAAVAERLGRVADQLERALEAIGGVEGLKKVAGLASMFASGKK